MKNSNELPSIGLDRSGKGLEGDFISQEREADSETTKECPHCGKLMFKVVHEGSVDTWHCSEHGVAIDQDRPF